MYANALLVGILSTLAISSFGDTQYYHKWYFFFFFLAAAYSLKEIAPRLGWLAAIAFMYLIGNGIWTWIWPGNRYITVPVYDQMAIRYYAADATAKLFIVAAVFLALARKKDYFISSGRKLAQWFLVADFVMLGIHAGIQWYINGGICEVKNSCGGILRNPSMNASFMVACLPVAIHGLTGRWKIFFVVMTGLSAIVSHSSIGIGMFAVFLALMAYDSTSAKVRTYLLAASIWVMLAGGLFMSYMGSKRLFHLGMRDTMWLFFMDKWDNVATNVRTGLGFGTFGIFGRNAQHFMIDSPNKVWEWPWMHNDWLELAFDAGLIGLFLVLSVYAYALYRLNRRWMKAEFNSLLLLGIMALVNYPSHVAIGAAFGAWLLVVALLKSEPEEITWKKHMTLVHWLVSLRARALMLLKRAPK